MTSTIEHGGYSYYEEGMRAFVDGLPVRNNQHHSSSDMCRFHCPEGAFSPFMTGSQIINGVIDLGYFVVGCVTPY